MKSVHRLTIALAVGLALPALVHASSALSFEKDVRPILKAHCFHCHGEETKLKGDLDLRLTRFILKGGESGAAIVPGEPEGSLLVQMVREGEMPKGEKKLKPGQIEAIEKWIAEGAKTLRAEPGQLAPGPVITEEERAHWAFQPIRKPPTPEVNAHGRVRTPVDAFLLAKLEQRKLTFSADADRSTLIRRATLDLTGLPPTPEEVEQFVADERSDAYERLIERLLASPRYGERWGRHWLDVAGYADSEGYNDADTPRNDAWLYRDYVIRAFNENKPFDQFIREQLAGDEILAPPYKNLAPAQVGKLAATGFLRMAPDGTGTRNDDQDAARHAVIAETVKIVSTSLLGMTVACAECHDHRYDPIPQRDYYRLRAIFEPALDWKSWREPRQRQISLLSDEERRRADEIEKEARAIEAELKPKLEAMRDWIFEEEIKAVPANLQAAGRAAWEQWVKDEKQLTPEQRKLLDDYPRLKVSASAGILNLFLSKYGRQKELQDMQDENAKRAAAVRKRKPAEQFVRALTEVPGAMPATYVFHRGDRNQPGDAVLPGDLGVLGGDTDIPTDDPALPTSGRRLAFAKHLTDGGHPLLARVLVNRFWMHHFGRGLVGTPADFGTQGERPSHPELLDWLAAEFMSGGWDLKAFHRLVMTSTAYRQSSARHLAGDRVDSGNTLLWRMNVRRLEAETIRDSILAITGKLNTAMFGPPVTVSLDENQQVVVGSGQEAKDGSDFRRSVYVQMRRSQPAYLLDVFDAPDMEPNCEVRNASTVAPQALLLMNSRFVLDQSMHFAARVQREAGDDVAAQVVRAWRLAFGGEPPAAERAQMTDYLGRQAALLQQRAAWKDPTKARSQALASLCQVLLGSNQLLYVD